MLTELGERIDEYSESFNKELENIKKKNKIRNEEFNSWNKKKNTRTEQQTRSHRRIHKWSGRQNNENHPIGKIKGQIIFKNESSLRDLWDTIKHTNISTVDVPEGQERGEVKNVFEEIMAKKFPNLKKEADIQVQD